MRFTDAVNVPNDLVDALEAGDLVFFVGAGASIAPPASLPDFHSLATQVADQAQYRHPFDGEELDAFFGNLERAGAPAHTLVTRALDSPDSAPNSIHEAVVRLAIASGKPKIITTNFDTLIQEAWRAKGGEFDEFIGPALPLGDNFTGLVQLHGSVKSPTREMVLTERSFGAAYLTRGWATRFLLDVFGRYTVVFVGYSHRDPVMRYLATALSMGAKRYAFVGVDNDQDDHEGDLSYLKILGVEPIPFPKENNYAALPAVLDEWARYAEHDWLGTRNRLREILLSIENVTPVETDFLERFLSNENGLENFSSVCSSLSLERQFAVLRWVRQLPLFRGIFDRQIRFERGEDLEPLIKRVSDSLCAGVWFTSSPRIGRGKPRLVG